MDSMVFFVAALTICGILVSYARPSAESRADLRGDADPAEVLRVLLRASIGHAVSIDLEGNHLLDGTEDVAACIAVEMCALSSGAGQTVFSSLNAIILEIMISVCNPVFEPSLTVYDLDGVVPTPVLKIPCERALSEDRYASSTEIPRNDGDPYTVVLVLSPAASPELV